MTTAAPRFGGNQPASYDADMRVDRFSVDSMTTTRIRIEVIRTLACWPPLDPSRMPDAVADIEQSRVSRWLKGGLKTRLPASPGDQRKLLI